jgi:hypothetical protein
MTSCHVRVASLGPVALRYTRAKPSIYFSRDPGKPLMQKPP